MYCIALQSNYDVDVGDDNGNGNEDLYDDVCDDEYEKGEEADVWRE